MNAADPPRITPRQLPATGPNEQKARFFAELAAGVEFLALWHTLSAAQQRDLNAHLNGAAAETYTRASKDQS